MSQESTTQLDKAISVYVTTDEAQALVLLAAREDRTLSYLIRELIRERLALETARPEFAEPSPEGGAA